MSDQVRRLLIVSIAALVPGATLAVGLTEQVETPPAREARKGASAAGKNGGHRGRSEFVLKALELKPGDVVVDIGAGDGWWSERMVKYVGDMGVIHAAEVDQKKVDLMKKKFDGVPQVLPYLCPKDSPGLPERSCDLAFFSESYHHLGEGNHVGYLKRLRSTLKPTGRVVIIERYTGAGLGSGTHGTRLSRLIEQAEEAGWVPVRTELMPGTYRYLAILAQKEQFPPEPVRKKASTKRKAAVTAPDSRRPARRG